MKGKTCDLIKVVRDNGAVDISEFPKKGVVPHDAVHWIVERHMGMVAGFWGTVFSGVGLDAVADRTRAGGHASSTRAVAPDATIVELVQAERLVECFEADMWSVPSAPEVFRDVLRAACLQSQVAAPAITDADILKIRKALKALHESWGAIPLGTSLGFGVWSAPIK
ncbi:MAG: hypothetical protein AAGA68_23055 [Pseudomonadota bacterium]